MTPTEIRQQGYQALVDRLGAVNAIRFLQDVGGGSGDYTQERKEIINQVTREELWQDVQRLRSKKKN
ncbi:UNVERIFIED_CONTAM: hypothetical protein BEN50_01720 [Euhalothece sp. KZN 001]